MTLISRLEQAEAGSRELDLEIFLELNPRFRELPRDDRPTSFGWTHPLDGRVYFDTPYTTSIDAAMSLAGESPQPSEIMREALWLVNKKHSLHICTWPKTLSFQNELALALCVASLKAAGYE